MLYRLPVPWRCPVDQVMPDSVGGQDRLWWSISVGVSSLLVLQAGGNFKSVSVC